MYLTPDENTEKAQTEVIIFGDKKHHQLVLYFFGVFFVGIIVWGVVQIRKTDTAVMPYIVEDLESPKTEEETVRGQIELLATDSDEQKLISKEETQAQLEILAPQDEAVILLTEQDIRAQLGVLATQD